MYIYIYIHIYVSLSLSLYIYIYMYIYIYIYTYRDISLEVTFRLILPVSFVCFNVEITIRNILQASLRVRALRGRQGISFRLFSLCLFVCHFVFVLCPYFNVELIISCLLISMLKSQSATFCKPPCARPPRPSRSTTGHIHIYIYIYVFIYSYIYIYIYIVLYYFRCV